jgi:hypothetical protein
MEVVPTEIIQFTKNSKARFFELAKNAFCKTSSSIENEAFGLEVATQKNGKTSASLVSLSERIDKMWNARRRKTYDPSFVIMKGIGVCGKREIVHEYLKHVLAGEDEKLEAAISSLISRGEEETTNDSQQFLIIRDDKIVVSSVSTNDRIHPAVDCIFKAVSTPASRRKASDKKAESPRPRSPFPGAFATTRLFVGAYETISFNCEK